MKILNVAEKPSAAEEISSLLAGSRPFKRGGLCKYNPIWEFKYNMMGGLSDMVFTSVLGHLMNTDVVEPYTNWNSCDPIDLFDVKVHKLIKSDENNSLYKTIQREAKNCQAIVLWLDCDREGENIAFEVLDCAIKSNRNLQIFRAKFSSIIPSEVKRACANLIKPNEKDSIAVDTRIEIDLRLGAVFTRFQTKYLKSKFDLQDDQPISYGPCQFPTLGFVVERYMRIENFVPEDHWTISVKHTKEDKSCNFHWKRKHLFQHAPALILFEQCLDNPLAKVINIQTNNNQFKPVPLTTIELQKNASWKLRLSSDKTMKLAEELYNKGFISYPRTETSQFLDDTDFNGLIKLQTDDRQWGQYAQGLLDGGFQKPRLGKTNDNSHPPIHPTNYLAPNNGAITDPKAKELYEFIVRHFLACCSQESIIGQTTITIDIAGEQFSDSGSMMIRRGYLDIYKYEKKSDRIIPTYEVGEEFMPSEMTLDQGRTVAPRPLSEPELLSEMDKNQIGTDATMASHIKKIIDRGYVTKDADQLFIPTNLGKALIIGYEMMGFNFAKPELRATIEADIQRIATGHRTPQQVLTSTIEKYKALYIQATNSTTMLDQSFSKYFSNIGNQYKLVKPNFSKCGKCNQLMDLKTNNDNKHFIVCNQCKDNFNLPQKGTFTAGNHTCPLCQFQIVVVQSSETSSYTICPYCRGHPPASFKEPGKPFHCFQCTEKCPLAKGHTYKPQPQTSTFKPSRSNTYNKNTFTNSNKRGGKS